MTVYLVQHATAKTKEEDPQRPLSAEGRDEILKTASFAAHIARIRPSRIIHSEKTRAAETAQVLAEHLSLAERVAQADGLAPMDDVSVWAERLAGMDEDVVLVGHLPHLSRLAAMLLCDDDSKTIVGFRRGGVVALERDDAGSWSVGWMIVPRVTPSHESGS